MRKELIERSKEDINNDQWYLPWSDVLKREADFQVEYDFFNNDYSIYVGMQTHFKYEKNDERVWIILPEFLDEDGVTIIDRRRSPSVKGKADMWILNEENLDFHKTKISVGVTAYMTFFNTVLAELKVTKINFK